VNAGTASTKRAPKKGDEQLERAYAHGMALNLDQALDLAPRKGGTGRAAGRPLRTNDLTSR
jgi:hypothetical protein